ncbi:1-deoxy-D-xylulose-5-phosphate reductoisomerase [Serpentinicella alkaliphila]|uniref:1-deoxy-D-xylulose 5-phosphate reductoisomerase n=1 Tax=Serpentinicella alkaliphila TaxID=1734049 RepID=A0A4R2U6T1_9FIRM|nr:1-deoxy-D-xylulose-5-phosphate reductoisomerase [Serpentinicella alkaliphila]QUH26319.1 1-deoxy-D-xylulose-5-phosphate reductoisomerase [Serpentinicella alkaliphila]TCQ05899.1 1-deoxy-D-xylulose 5-phosphate reductoisomerase [Serpentinicella alkaliphila]
MKKRISILGSTGSIGTQTLDVIREHRDRFEVVALGAMQNIDELEKQIDEFKPKFVAVYDKNKADILKNRISSKTKIISSIEGLIEIASLNDIDLVLNSVVGSIGLLPTLHAIKARKNIALANKETLVVGGELITKELERYNVNIIPVDSEHSAIFQCLQGEKREAISKLILTASGGPFNNWELENLKDVTYKEALKHPNWSMGKKISIDSATLMNKGLEVIEAKWLFDIDVDKIEVVIHPQSIIHSMVEFKDTSVIAQLGLPDMRLPIQYALTYPKRLEMKSPGLNFMKYNSLTFNEPDYNKFPCLRLAYDAMKIGGTMPCVLNAANEVLVNLFLEQKIKFFDIPYYIEKIMDIHEPSNYNSYEELLEVDIWAREWITKNIR